ncbi:uncharacterized protein LOC129549462 isoform X3 [Moschus berezovskii]|uniref:uncharacterized protein LOC129549462 isoform X3 n=1 Tax=Moschus berezovskii TaxID=68408 RepID=UPI0024440ED3|nr:uncharacterized protein LOC129549462 isoform X3 [Moschus berezovskii]
MPVMKGFHIVSYPIIERCSPPRHSTFSSNLGCSPIISCINILAGSKMSTEAQRVDDSPGTSGGSSDGDQRESVQQEPEREQVQPKKKEGKISSKTAAKLSTSAKRIQKELAEITLDPPPNCRCRRAVQLAFLPAGKTSLKASLVMSSDLSWPLSENLAFNDRCNRKLSHSRKTEKSPIWEE